MAEGGGGKKFKQGGSSGGAGGFKALGLTEDVFRGVVRLGFKSPTPVQRKALPVILSGVDTVVMARTGSGKTVAFLIPLLEKLLAEPPSAQKPVRAIILSPTRELSQQTLNVFFKFTSVLKETNPIRAVGIHGGEGLEKQFSLLSSQPDVIIATPGRLAHHLSEIPDFTLDACQMCILDEADRLMEMGFAMQLRQISKTFPSNCQKVLLSATLPRQLVEFTKSGFAVDPTVVRLDHEATVSAELRIAFITCRSLDKDAAFLHLLHHIKQDTEEHQGENSARTGLTLVFCATRHHVDYVATLLTASGIPATMIYGSMDQEARQSNLAAFRTGKQPVLVVTDVAARGIDVPLIDHVIHYHFPPSPKLFVHRSGRAARAGRIGFCWGLVEPDELPYMIDLHLFLGRKPTPGVVANDEKGSSEEKKQLTYALDEMTPDMVHYGSLPESVMTEEVENVQRIMNSEMSGSLDSQALKNLTKVCNNAMKQYRRTRNEASREAVRRAKAILEGERMETGERVGGGAIYPHPLLRGMEIKRIQKMGKDKEKGIGALSNAKKRQEFLVAMANFRPKETVFEAFATGGGRDVGVVSHIDKGRTTHGKKHDSNGAMSAMKNMRRQMRMARDKGSSLVVAGSSMTEEQNDDDDDDNSMDEEEKAPSSLSKLVQLVHEKQDVLHESGQRRLTKAERRRLKKNPQATVERVHTEEKLKEVKTDFRDPSFYMENDFTGNAEEADRSRKVESMLQPSSSAVRGMAGRAVRMEEAMLDIVGDDNDALIQKQRMVRWDKSKRKYVQTTVGDELAGHSKTKKIRLESGQLARKDDSKLGDLYSKWQKKTNRSVGRTGVFDDNPGPMNVKGSRGKKSPGGKPDKSELKGAAEIKKERDRQQNLKMKNMKKQDRRVVERKQKEERNANARKEFNKSAPRRKKR